MQVAEALEMPAIVTEQYPKGLLHTVEELQPLLKRGQEAGRVIVHEKVMFSMCLPEVRWRWLLLWFCADPVAGLVILGRKKDYQRHSCGH